MVQITPFLSTKKFNNKKRQKLKYLLENNFEKKGLFLSYGLFSLKKKNVPKVNQTVKYLTTSRYVIPLPSDDSEKVKSTKRKIPNCYGYLDKLYSYYKGYFNFQRGFFYTTFWDIYTPTKTSTVQKYAYDLKFEILKILHFVYWFLSDFSFCWVIRWNYYSQKWFKVFSIIFFTKLFLPYRNPNLPLRWTHTLEHFTPKIQGQALFRIKEFIFWQLVFERLGMPYSFSREELKIFKLALIDPYDKWFFWNTWWLHLLGVSTHDGWISLSTNKTHFKSFSNIPIGTVDPKIKLLIKEWLLVQLVIWKETFMKLLRENKLFFEWPHSCNFKLQKISVKTNYNFKLTAGNMLINRYLTWLGASKKSINFLHVPLPTYFIGTHLEFSTKPYLEFSHQDLTSEKPYIKLTPMLDVVKFFLFCKQLAFFDSSKYNNTLLLFLTYYKLPLNSKFRILLGKKDNVMARLFRTKWTKNNEINELWRFYLNKHIKPTKHNSIPLTTTDVWIFKLPSFLQLLFFLCLQPNLSPECLDFAILTPLLLHLPIYKKIQTLEKKRTYKFLGPLLVFKKFFSKPAIYKNINPTVAYKLLRTILKTMPNKDFLVEWFEPFGANPFFEFNKVLTAKTVPFPEAISNFTYFKFLWKKLLDDGENDNTSLKTKLTVSFCILSIIGTHITYVSLGFSSTILLLFISYCVARATKISFLYKKRYTLFFKVRLQPSLKWNTLKQTMYSIALESYYQDTLDLKDNIFDAFKILPYPKNFSKQLFSPFELDVMFEWAFAKFKSTVFVTVFTKQREYSFLHLITKILRANIFFRYLFSIWSVLAWNRLAYSTNFFYFNYTHAHVSAAISYVIPVTENSFFSFLRIYYFCNYFLFTQKKTLIIKLKKW